MAYEELGHDKTFTAGADLSSHQFGLVKLDTTAGQVVVATAASMAIGVLQNKPTSGKLATVRTAPGVITPVRVGAAVSLNDTLESDADGEAVTLTIDGDGTTETWLVGIALAAATAADQIIPVLTKFVPTSK